MQKGICFFFGVGYDPVQRAKDIKMAGFDAVIANADPRFDKQNAPFKKQIRLFKKNGLGVSSLHMRYKRDELPHFWLDDDIGKKLEKNLVKDIKLADKFGFKCVVVHMNGEVSTFGIERFYRILKVAEKHNVSLALENLNDDTSFRYLMDNVKHPLVRFCFDVGHQNAFHPETDYLKLYGDRLICLHLHDNDGTADQHTLNSFGTIDWKKIAKSLAKYDDISLDYELMPRVLKGFSAKEVLTECFKQAVELETMIEKEREKLKTKKQKGQK